MTQAARFRELLRRDGMVVAPGAYDCITARLIERAGFDAVYMTGAGTAATLGYPDFGLVTMSETRRHPPLVREMTVREVFQLSGADEWDALRTRFRTEEN